MNTSALSTPSVFVSFFGPNLNARHHKQFAQINVKVRGHLDSSGLNSVKALQQMIAVSEFIEIICCGLAGACKGASASPARSQR
jgi:hypothetical protein